MKHTKHNPGYRLVSKTITAGNKLIELVYGVTNDGANEGIEVYFISQNLDIKYSRRYSEETLPVKYKNIFTELRAQVINGNVSAGHKLYIN